MVTMKEVIICKSPEPAGLVHPETHNVFADNGNNCLECTYVAEVESFSSRSAPSSSSSVGVVSKLKASVVK